MALTASDYIVLNGLGIANSWAQNRMARLSLEQKKKDSIEEERFRRDELRQRGEDARLNRENQMTISTNSLNREDKRAEASDERLQKRLNASLRATWDRRTQDEAEQLRDIDAKDAIEKSREKSKMDIEKLKMGKEGLKSAGEVIARLFGIPTKESVDVDNQRRLVMDKRSSDAIQGYKAMDYNDQAKWKLVPNERGYFSLVPRVDSEPAPAEQPKETKSGKLTSGATWRMYPNWEVK